MMGYLISPPGSSLAINGATAADCDTAQLREFQPLLFVGLSSSLGSRSSNDALQL